MSRHRIISAAALAALLILPALAVTACNTVEGAGQDIKKAGQWIERQAGEKK